MRNYELTRKGKRAVALLVAFLVLLELFLIINAVRGQKKGNESASPSPAISTGGSPSLTESPSPSDNPAESPSESSPDAPSESTSEAPSSPEIESPAVSESPSEASLPSPDNRDTVYNQKLVVEFELDKSEVDSAEAFQSELKAFLPKDLVDFAAYSIIVEGISSSSEDAILAPDRAYYVSEALQKLGVPKEQLIIMTASGENDAVSSVELSYLPIGSK